MKKVEGLVKEGHIKAEWRKRAPGCSCMQIEIRSNRDFWAGVMLIVTGATSGIVARDYAFGTSVRLGPGYSPSVLGGLLVLFGLYLAASGLRSNEKIEGGWSLR